MRVIALNFKSVHIRLSGVMKDQGTQRDSVGRNIRFTVCLVLINLLVPPALHAWQKSIRFERITLEQGLPDYYVRSITQDKYGFMWFGTANGLAKYDGYHFTVYKHDFDDPNSISSNEILSVFEDQQGTLWVGTDAGLNRFNRGQETFTHFRHNPENPASLGGEVVPTIFEDQFGVLWVGHWFAGLSRFDRASETFVRYIHDPDDPTSLPQGVVMAVHEDRSGVLRVGTFAHEGTPDLALFNRETGTFSRFFSCEPEQPQCAQPLSESDRPPVSQINGIFEDGAGNMWIGGYGLIKYDRANNTYMRYSHDPENPDSPAGNRFAGDMVEDSTGRLWFADTYQGLTSFDPETEKFDHYRHDPADSNSIGSNDLYTLYEDRDGIIWVAAYSNGISKFDPHSLAFGHYKHDPNEPNSLAHNIIEDITEDKNGLLWAAAGGLNRIDRSAGTVTVYRHDPDDPNSLHNNDIRALHATNSGMLWIGTIFGLSRFDPETGTFKYYPVNPKTLDSNPQTPRDAGVLSIAEDANGFLWLGTHSTVSRLDPATGSVIHYHANPDQPNALHGNTFGLGFIADNGNVWITSSTGINRFDPHTETFSHYVHEPKNPDSIRQGPVTAILQESDNVIWVGTASGLDRLDPVSGVFSHQTNSDGSSIEYVVGIVPDGRGNLWVGTRSQGILKIDTATAEFRNYGVRDGLAGDNIAGRGLLSRSGEIIFGSQNGITIFDSEDLPEYQQESTVVITDFRLLNEPVQISTPGQETPLVQHINQTTDITLSYKDYLFSFEFAALNYSDPISTRYAYMLEGFDRDWIETDASNRFATYTSVPPGDYVLRVKSSNRDGDWSKNNTSIRLNILPPLWRTWWAYSLYVIAFILVLFAYVMLRTINLTRRARLLEKTVEERTAKIRKHEQQIQHQAEDLEELLHLKEELIANISHEFRTPLTLILGPAKRMLQKTANQENRTQLQMIKRNSQRLLRLVDQLLGLARLGAEEPLALSAQPITSIADAITESFQVLAEEKGLELTIEHGPELWVNCTPDSLEKILLNLLSNAIKYTPAGGRITVSTALNDDNMVELSVRDTGVGIAGKDQKAVFERFHRLGDRGELVPGAGIGLALVKELVDAHNGRIQLLSTPGEGTTVTIQLPHCLEAPETPETEPRIVSSEVIELEADALVQHDAVSGTVTVNGAEDQPSILVVEDNVDMQNYLVELLSGAYHCDVASDGQQALEAAFERIPDLVLCDVMLPRLDGFQVSHALKEDERTSHIPIIMLTARSDRYSRMEGWQKKIDGYFTKPFDDEELKLRIANLLDIRDILKNRFSSQFFEESRPNQVLNEKENRFMEKLNRLLERCHVDPKFDLSQMAFEMHMSPRQVQRKLKAITGHHPAEFLRSFRLKKARELLRTGTQVGLASDAVGFSSPAYFASCFKAQFTQTPTEYQQRFH